VQRSLVDTTAHLFDADAAATRIADDLSGGVAMSPFEPTTLNVVSRRGEARSESNQPDAASALLSDPRRLQQLVDVIVDRIERRVVDELERRGRRQRFGAF
jgi:hypothetical protein